MAVRQATLDIDTLYVSTWQAIKDTIVNNIFTASPFWYYLSKKNHRQAQIGGKWVEIPLEYATSATTVAWLAKDDSLASQVTAAKAIDPLTSAQYDWAYITASLYRYWQDDAQNRGKEALKNLVTVKLSNARRSLEAALETALFTLTVPGSDHKITGLPNMIMDDPNPTGSTYYYGGILQGNSSGQKNVWWNNQSYDMTDEDVTVNLITRMRTMFNDCSDAGGTDTPDLLLTGQDVFEAYEEEVGEMKSIVNSNAGDAGFESLMFKGKPFVWSGACDADELYFLNMNYLYWQYDPGIDFEMTEWKTGQNDLDRVAQIVTAGQLVCSQRRRQGKIFGIGLTS